MADSWPLSGSRTLVFDSVSDLGIRSTTFLSLYYDFIESGGVFVGVEVEAVEGTLEVDVLLPDMRLPVSAD